MNDGNLSSIFNIYYDAHYPPAKSQIKIQFLCEETKMTSCTMS
jgi:hypothetical protein